MASEWGKKITIGAADEDLLPFKKGPATTIIALASGTVIVRVPKGGVPQGESQNVELTFGGAGEGRGILIEAILGTGNGSSAIDVEVHWDVGGS